ncbi:Putative histone H1.6 [Caenorhabditis elegans]|uniref:Putative histone H1.6 n=1 Tax=Caenorhabditis elegans TaxID=6239 RepID=H16_CAEEL|nr:Putative histone H1.6 [Caenorhabditis elegans]O16277.3 RecName: Full=Putative histone H1.6; AltName: Full=Histone H1-like protein 6 [Caenorhabditis elegans]CCD72097.1 Putative histone H1.6 [Caenorhabditis elegans]|eukprot:NP_503554.1 Putative histone H1.6 [Caenorhabditis elegans]
MSDVAVAETPAVKTPTKAPKANATKVPKVKTAAAHPPFINMVTAAISSLKERKGSSKIAILKYITANYKLGDQVKKINSNLRSALKKGVASKALVQTVGTGATGRFRVAEKTAATAKKPTVKKAATGEKVKKTVVKKTVAKKTGDKVKKAKSPKKIAKPAAKKATKSPSKKVAPKKAAAKPAKKTAALKA